MDRALLVVLLLVVCMVAAAAIRVGWRHRAERQTAFPQLHPVPADLPPGVGSEPPELSRSLTGLYVSTTRSGSWQDRIVARTLGRRAAATVHLFAAGVLIDRVGESAIFLPVAHLLGVGTAPGIAGKVMGMPDGILLLTWSLGDERLDSGLRIDDLDAQDEWIEAARALLGEGGRDLISGTESTSPGVDLERNSDGANE